MSYGVKCICIVDHPGNEFEACSGAKPVQASCWAMCDRLAASIAASCAKRGSSICPPSDALLKSTYGDGLDLTPSTSSCTTVPRIEGVPLNLFRLRSKERK